MSSALSLVLSVLVGSTIGLADFRAEELQTPGALLFSAAFVLAAWHPEGAWRRGMILGLSVPMAHAIAHLTGATLPYTISNPLLTLAAIVPAMMGTGIGMGVARLRHHDEAPASPSDRGGRR